MVLDFFPLTTQWIFLLTWWIFKRHAAICKTNYHRIRIKVIMYLYFSYLGTSIVWNYKVHFFSPPSLKELAKKPLLRNLVVLIHVTKHRQPTQQPKPLKSNKKKWHFLILHGLHRNTKTILLFKHLHITQEKPSVNWPVSKNLVELWHNERVTC